jgi:hypothetical protein
MYKLINLLLLTYLPLAAICQTPTFSEGNEENYAFEVKVIDEFIERFNGSSLLLDNYVKNKKLPNKTDRFTLLRDLFDKHATQKWNLEEVKQFIKQVSDSSSPVYINFNDKGWFAELNCKVLYKGKPQKADLILKVKVEENANCKWVITGVTRRFFTTS